MLFSNPLQHDFIIEDGVVLLKSAAFEKAMQTIGSSWECRKCKLRGDTAEGRKEHNRSFHAHFALLQWADGSTAQSLERSSDGFFYCSGANACGFRTVNTELIKEHHKTHTKPSLSEYEAASPIPTAMESKSLHARIGQPITMSPLTIEEAFSLGIPTGPKADKLHQCPIPHANKANLPGQNRLSFRDLAAGSSAPPFQVWERVDSKGLRTSTSNETTAPFSESLSEDIDPAARKHHRSISPDMSSTSNTVKSPMFPPPTSPSTDERPAKISKTRADQSAEAPCAMQIVSAPETLLQKKQLQQLALAKELDQLQIRIQHLATYKLLIDSSIRLFALESGVRKRRVPRHLMVKLDKCFEDLYRSLEG